MSSSSRLDVQKREKPSPFSPSDTQDTKNQNRLTDNQSVNKSDESLSKLKAKDRQVRAHEAAHRQAGGRFIRGRTGFKTEKGSDGKEYAVGGDVKIDTSSVAGDSKASLAKAQLIERAALAPADPSTQDRVVAAKAARMAAIARADIAKQRAEKMRADDSAMDVQSGVTNANLKAINAFQSLQSSESVEAIDLVV
ncbi:MAG: putative metalloprotease CJM1_0395 family protein [Thiohalomonadales bacterium]